MTRPRTLAARTLLASFALALSFVPALAQTAPAPAQTQAAEMEPRAMEGKATREHWDPAQLITATVHQAWVLSNRNEANFYEMIEQLADISAKNRGIKLPESAAAGRRMGQYIKRSASADTDQLLFAVVDKAVVMTAKVPTRAPAPAK